MWILPTYHRPEQAQATLDSIAQHRSTTPGVVYLDGSTHPAYQTLRLPPQWTLYHSEVNRGICGVLNHFLSLYPNLPWYGLITDDSLVRTDRWDEKLLAHVTPHNIVHSADGWQAEWRIHGAVIFGGDLLRALGWWAPPTLIHSFCDDAWEALAKEASLRKYVPEVMVEHLHMWNGKAPIDRSYCKAYESFERDERAFLDWKEKEFLSALAPLLHSQKPIP